MIPLFCASAGSWHRVTVGLRVTLAVSDQLVKTALTFAQASGGAPGRSPGTTISRLTSVRCTGNVTARRAVLSAETFPGLLFDDGAVADPPEATRLT
jgi:hypothetical protein